MLQGIVVPRAGVRLCWRSSNLPVGGHFGMPVETVETGELGSPTAVFPPPQTHTVTTGQPRVIAGNAETGMLKEISAAS
jgi:hypothetical protein